MITMDAFLFGLLIISVLTGLVVEALKKILTENNIDYRANTLAGLVSLVLSGGAGVAYVIVNNIGFTTHSIICIIAEVFMSWLCAMVGYDKVIQTIGQFINKKD